MTDRRTGEALLAVVATAGHVDHGKSSLIVRLTGMDPDRLAEEKRRGLTIDLGFAWLTLPSGHEVGFVDVPGHERFVGNMLAGVGPVRLVLFVVAADEGWKPQSEEHLAILDVLGTEGAVIALTKRDLVGEERLHAAEAEVRERIRGTTLEGASIVACSSATGDGIDELAQVLDAMVSAAPDPERTGRPRLFVDRVFSAKGSGTVVTGTLTGGPLTVGDQIAVAPGLVGRIRGIQSHEQQLTTAAPVSRVALNLVGLDRDAVVRGDVVVRPGGWRPTTVFEARLRPVRGLGRPLSARGAFKLHAGSAERDVRIRLYRVPNTGEEVFARVRSSTPLVLEVFDRFVLRESGRRETVAGGIVLDTEPPARPGRNAEARLAARAGSERAELPGLLIAERGAIRAGDLTTLLGREPDAVNDAGRVSGWWISSAVREAVGVAVLDQLAIFHERDPLAAGVDLEIVRGAVLVILQREGAPTDPSLADALVDDLAERGMIAREGSSVRLPAHRLDAGSEGVDRVVAAVADAEPTPPTIAELLAGGHDRSELDAAVRSNALVRISPELVLTRAFVDRAIEAVRLAGEEGITVSAFRELLGTSRKYAIPLMEHLDRSGVTRRSGDLRFARSSLS